MSDKSEINICNNDNRIAKNTIMLYFRMLLLMLVSLYTVRVVLAVLGDVDYGIFNVVGGIVSMFSFISASMVSASQRFLTFELAKGDTVKLRQTFSMILTIYIFFSIAIILLSETLGLAFIEYKLVIPESRNEAVLWVYHFSVLSFVFTILTIPYNAIIIAHEHMSVFAYISILEGVLRLLIVYLLCIFPCDKLKLYAILTFLVTLCISALYCAYSRWRYPESRCGFYWNKPLAKTILGYSGWNLLGAFSGVANSHGLNILINLFYGPVVNTAMSIADKIRITFFTFASNFYLAVTPPIIKSYANNDMKRLNNLICYSTKFVFFLLLVFSIPLFLKMEFVLNLWLGHSFPEMIVFSKLMIIYVLILSLENPLTQAVRATGHIKYYQIWISFVTFLSLPISYLLLKWNFPAGIVIVISSIVYIIATFVRIIILNRLISFPVIIYIKRVLFRILFVTFFSFASLFLIDLNMPNNDWLCFFMILIASTCIVGLGGYFIGFSSNERNILLQMKNNMFRKKI